MKYYEYYSIFNVRYLKVIRSVVIFFDKIVLHI